MSLQLQVAIAKNSNSPPLILDPKEFSFGGIEIERSRPSIDIDTSCLPRRLFTCAVNRIEETEDTGK